MHKYAITLLLGILLLHCAASQESTFDDYSQESQSDKATKGTGGGFSFNTNNEPPSVDGNFGGAGTCYSDEVKQEIQNVNMVILLDRSGSMMGFRWDTSISELGKFIKDPKSSGINTALSYFPALPDDISCDEKLYEAPYIQFGVLPYNSNIIISSLNSIIPNGGGTPLYSAMLGTYNWLISYAQKNSSSQSLVLIVSDGDPNTCTYPYNSKEELGDLAELAFDSGVKTVTIALNGANLVTLDYIAYKGGTNAAVNIMYDTTALYTALNTIRSSFQCEYVFDQPATFDPEMWFVKYLSSNGFPDWLIPRVENKTECENQHGWYYDDNKNPAKLTLCTKACEILTFDENFTLQLAFGCPSGSDIVK
jgi:hypothetical protein